MDKSGMADRIMRDLNYSVQRRLELSEHETEIRLNTKRTAARLLARGENMCTVSTDYGLGFAVWKKTEYHDNVSDLLKTLLDKSEIPYTKRERGCGETEHTFFEVDVHGEERKRLEKGARTA